MGVHFGKMDHDLARLGGQRYWAERGLVHVEDAKDGSYKTMSVHEFLQRANALSDALGNKASNRDSGADRHLRQVIQGFLDRAVTVAEKAKVQGMPSDPSARRDLANRRPKTICMSGGRSLM